MTSPITTSTDYVSFLNTIKDRIHNAQSRAVRSVNKELIKLYWDIGEWIVENQERLGWGKGIIEMLSKDIRKEFPRVKGFSSRNLWDMRRFYLHYHDMPNLRQFVAEIPWGLCELY